MAFQTHSVATFRLADFAMALMPGKRFQSSNQPLVVGSDQAGKLLFGRKEAIAGLAGVFTRRVDGNVVFFVDRVVSHCLFTLARRGHDDTFITLARP
jgi:hypothetical protein